MKERYLSLDVMRGLTIALMIIVNTPGSWSNLYAPLAHAAWHGFTPTDLVFPSFLFIVGTAMSFSFTKYLNSSTASFYGKVVKRTFLIFLIGYLLNAFPFYEVQADGKVALIDFSKVRLLGVLQRIALCYFIASVVVYHFKKRGALIVSIIFLLGYWAVMGALGDFEMLTNIGHKMDLWLLGSGLLYQGEGVPFDPEGLLSSLPATVNVLAGYLTGLYVKDNPIKKDVALRLLVGGIGLILLSLMWDMIFPINKKIWTSSFVLLTCGLDLLILVFLIITIEILGKKSWTYFFEVFGKNPLILYVLSLIIIRFFYMIKIGDQTLKAVVYHQGFTSWLTPKSASFMFAIVYMLLIWLIGLWMDRKGKYIKV
ncbi:MAG TPA: heparan-alpha-glucosaminide N-acetyltransferase domain-containing protein [Saprospiraceae bacterium]|nr:heparan-alpha-glucosaminide N-acetyltransferase domain-containing protein [Saprospiraceae bacterium]